MPRSSASSISVPSSPAPRSLPKGQQTKAHIVDVALHMATHHGLESLSIGGLAEAIGMSKSGVFAHFGSREELQISVVREYHQRFEQEVFYPALQAPRSRETGRLPRHRLPAPMKVPLQRRQRRRGPLGLL